MSYPRIAIAIVLTSALCSAASAVPISIVDTLPGAFDDITSTGTLLPVAGDGEAMFVSSVGNAILPAGDIWVGENGGLAFGTPPDTDLEPTNAPLPSILAFGGGQSILAYWDDLEVPVILGRTVPAVCPGKMGGVLYAVATGNKTVVQWNACRRRNPFLAGPPNGDTVQFQIQIFDDPVGPFGILAQIIYTDIEGAAVLGGAGATIGYQDGGMGNNDFQWSFDTAGSVSNTTVLSIIPEPATAILVAMAGLAIFRTRRRIQSN